MKLFLILLTLISVSCSNMKLKPTLAYELPPLELNEQDVPVECYDDEGNFDSNRGHDYLDCDNLDNRIKF